MNYKEPEATISSNKASAISSKFLIRVRRKILKSLHAFSKKHAFI